MRVVIATIQTDIHDIGKNIVASMLTAAGYDVTDLGVDVPLKTIVDKAEELGAQVIAVSALLTTSMPYMKDLVNLLRDVACAKNTSCGRGSFGDRDLGTRDWLRMAQPVMQPRQSHWCVTFSRPPKELDND